MKKWVDVNTHWPAMLANFDCSLLEQLILMDAAGEYYGINITIPKTGQLLGVSANLRTSTGNLCPINVSIETLTTASTAIEGSGVLYAANATGSWTPATTGVESTIVNINGSSGIQVTQGDIISVKYAVDYAAGGASKAVAASGSWGGISFPSYYYRTGGVFNRGLQPPNLLLMYSTGYVLPPGCSHSIGAQFISYGLGGTTFTGLGNEFSVPFDCEIDSLVGFRGSSSAPVTLRLFDSAAGVQIAYAEPNQKYYMGIQMHLPVDPPVSLQKNKKYIIACTNDTTIINNVPEYLPSTAMGGLHRFMHGGMYATAVQSISTSSAIYNWQNTTGNGVYPFAVRIKRIAIEERPVRWRR